MGSLYIVCSLQHDSISALLGSSSSKENLIVHHHHFRGYILRATVGLLAIACGLGMTIRQGRAQDADDPQDKSRVIEPDPRAALPTLQTILRRGTFDSGEEEAFVKHYKKWSLPRLTTEKFRSRQPWKNDKPDVGTDIVREIRSNLALAKTASSDQVHQRLAALILEVLPSLAKSVSFHPATRYNAMLIVGEVNSPDTVQTLVDIVKDPKQSDVVKVAALIGLIHQASHKWIAEADVQAAVVGEMAALAATPVPKDDRADAVRWMRGQAAEVLGQIGSPGKEGAAAAALLKMLGDNDLGPSQRAKAADALGRMNLAGASLVAGPYLEALGRLAADLVAAEKQQFNRRRIKGHLQFLLNGIKGPDAEHRGIAELAKAGAEQTRLDALQKAIDPLSQALDDPKATEDVLLHEVEKASDALDAIIKK